MEPVSPHTDFDSCAETAQAQRDSIQNPKSKLQNQKPTIRILSEALTSRIAAGEVIERPASVVKELLENALDAGASALHIEISSGGKKLIAVHDNGSGMSRPDLELCCLPHATSKIESAEDLTSLNTLGFRGEALPSIASVSHFTLSSRTRGEPSGWRIQLDGGEPERPQAVPAALAVGTRAEVRELFYNLPARKKFLKGDAAEAAACAEVVLRAAFCRPDVAFTLLQEGHEIFSVQAIAANTERPKAPGQAAPEIPAKAFASRARELLGRHNSQGLMELAVEGPSESKTPGLQNSQTPELSESFSGYRLYGLISPPAITRPNRSQLYLSVNGRPVKDRLLTSALLESFRHLLPAKRYPIAVLFLEVPAPDVDINVHPTKAEVRFRLPGLVYALFHHAVRTACGLPASSDSKDRSMPETQPLVPSIQPVAKPALGAPPIEPGQKKFDLWPVSEGSWQKTESRPQPPKSQHSGLNTQNISRVAESAPAYAAALPALGAPIRPPNPKTEIQNPKFENFPFRVLGQAGGSYIILEDDSGVKLVDQHALHERILFEELMARAEGRARGDSQGLLIAETLELSAPQAAAYATDGQAAEVLAELGFDVESFGPRTLAVRAVPAILKNNAAALVKDVLDALCDTSAERSSATAKPTRAALREKAIYILCCKGAIKAGERLTIEQMSALIYEFRKKVGRAAWTCPHGRPLAIELSWEDLERGVGRR